MICLRPAVNKEGVKGVGVGGGGGSEMTQERKESKGKKSLVMRWAFPCREEWFLIKRHFVYLVNTLFSPVVPSADFCKRRPHPGADVHHTKVGWQAEVRLWYPFTSQICFNHPHAHIYQRVHHFRDMLTSHTLLKHWYHNNCSSSHEATCFKLFVTRSSLTCLSHIPTCSRW